MFIKTESTDFGLITMTSDGDAITKLTWVEEKSTPDHSNAILDQAFAEIKEYAMGWRKAFTVPVSLKSCSQPLKRWLEVLRSVPYGTTVSYAELAKMAKQPKAPRSAGSACARNPIPIIYPCHRVTRSGGKLGNFGAIKTLPTDGDTNLAIKAKLIAHEHTHL
jgi:methylated-DNA-[protein]-cysteine S-methyltransferase